MNAPASNIRNIPFLEKHKELEKRVEGLEKQKGSSGGGGGSMEARVAKLEADVEHIKTDVSDIKIDIRDLRGDMNTGIGDLRGDMNTGIGDLRREHRNDFRMLVGLQFTTILGVIGLLVKVFS